MVFLICSIIFTSSLLIFFKLFEKYKVDAIQAIAINYVVAACVAIFYLDKSIYLSSNDSSWILISLGLGLMFSIIFNLSRFTTQKVGMGITSVAMKLGVVFPVLVGILFYKEPFGYINYLGLFLGIISIYFINKSAQVSENKESNISTFILPILVWVGSGVCDSLVQLIQKKYTIPANNGSFSFLTFWSAGFSSILFILFRRLKFNLKSTLGGIALGIPNFFSIYFLVKALENMKIEFNMNSSNLFMINNLSIVIFSVLIGIVLFKEKLNRYNYFGLALSLLSLLLINYK